MFGLELPGLGREVRKLVEITKGFRDHGRHIKLLSVQLFNRVEHLRGHDVFVL